MWYNKNVLIAGGGGFVGTNLVERLRSLGCKITSSYHSKKPSILYDDVEYIKADFTQKVDVQKSLIDIDYAFLLSSCSSGAAAIHSNPMIHVTPNILINTLFLECCYESGVKKVLYLSSTTGYPESGDEFLKESQMFEGEPYSKYYMTGWSKRFSEILCNMYSNKLHNKMPVVVLRPTNIYGPYDKFDFEKCHVLPSLIRKVIERQDPIEIWGNGEDERDFIFIDDMIEAIVVAMEKINTYDPVNIGYGKYYTVKELLDIIVQIDNYENAVVTFNLDKPTMIPKHRVSLDKSRDLLGFFPKIDLVSGIKRTIDFYRGSLKCDLG